MAATFEVPRDPCSVAYKAGARAAMRSLLDRVKEPRPYALGSAEADAWFAGFEEGRRRVRDVMAEQAEIEPTSRQVWCGSLYDPDEPARLYGDAAYDRGMAEQDQMLMTA
jgi:hypothetical protein